MYKIIILMLSGFACFASHAAVYKCSDGKYQDSPCHDNSQPIDLSEVGSVITSSATTAQATADNAQQGKRQEISNYIRKQQINRDISDLERDRKRVFVDRDKQIKQLQQKRNLANNNLAGATWEQSLAQEMSAVNSQADTEVASVDRQIEALRKQLDKLEALETAGNYY